MIQRPETSKWRVSTNLGPESVTLDIRDKELTLNHLQWHCLMMALIRSGQLLGWPTPMPEQDK